MSDYTPTHAPHRRSASLAAGLALGVALAIPAAHAATESTPPAAATAPDAANVLEREGLRVEFDAAPVGGKSGDTMLEGSLAEITIRITDSGSGEPVQGLYPAVWMDVSTALNDKQQASDLPSDCKSRVGTYLSGIVGVRPMIDLNSYFVMVMNQDPTITVIDPIVGITGITKLYAQVNLEKPGADWAKSADEKRMFVSMPLANQVAIVDLDRFKVTRNVTAGDNPTRLAIQPDQQYLWVGNNGAEGSKGGVTVLKMDDLSVAAFIETAPGHHEIAFSEDSRHAFVSNRVSGSVSVIDIASLSKLRDLKAGPLPISLAYSSLSDMLYVVDGQAGEVSVFDSSGENRVGTVKLAPGLGPMRFSQDGRWGIVVNPSADTAHVIDASTNRVAHDLKVGSKPFHVAFSRAFAYVRSLGTERVAMFEVALFDRPEPPPMITWAAGAKAPGIVADISLADAVVEAPGEAAVLVTSPGDGTVYYYMEGMNAPQGNFRNSGHRPRAVTVADRTLHENEPGVYSARVRLPAAGKYDVAFLLDSPRLLHCFATEAAIDPSIAHSTLPLKVEYLVEDRRVAANATVPLRFRLTDAATELPRADLDDVGVLFYRAPGTGRTEVPASEVGDGVYEAALPIQKAGAYYVYVGTRSGGIAYADLPFLTLRAVAPPLQAGQ